MEKLRLLVAEDHHLVRQGIINILEDFHWITVIAEAESGDALMEKYFRFEPDIVLTDVKMPRRDGMQAARKILNKDKAAKIVFLTMFNTDETLYEAKRIGAKGLLPKDIMKGELLDALKIVGNGGEYFFGYSEEKIKEILDRFETTKNTSNKNISNNLTEREIEILELLADGLSSEEIADKLFLGKRTVDSHRGKIMSKLNLHSVPKLIKFAVENFSRGEEY